MIVVLKNLNINNDLERNEIKMDDKKQKNKRDLGKVAVRVIALILAILMVLAVAATLIYYLVTM